MSTQSGHTSGDLVPLLDEHHLVVIGEPTACATTAQMLHSYLSAQPETTVLRLDGNQIVDGESFIRALGIMNAPATAETVAHRLRGGLGEVGKWVYIIWDHADVMMEANLPSFSRVANTLMAIAAESEHLDPDVLRIHRVVFLGGDKLGAYAEDSTGQFRVWLDDDVDEGVDEDDGDALWRITTCVPAPPVLTYRLDG